MKKNLGFTSFEFYFVISIIGLILLAGTQHYFKLTDETRRLSFEILAKNFSATVYNYHSHWILAQQSQHKTNRIVIGDAVIQFSAQGWPLAVNPQVSSGENMSLPGCISMWNAFLQNPPDISNEKSQGSYRVSLTKDNNCQYEMVAHKSGDLYFEYTPISGAVKVHTYPVR